jgi:transcriptional regulator with XRE-family HTH domain
MKNKITADRLRLALDMNHMSASMLSRRSGVSEASISQYINGSHAPSNITAGKIAEVLNVDPVWLMGFNVTMNIKNRELSDIDPLDAELDQKISQLDNKRKKILLGLVNSLLEDMKGDE